MMRMNQIYIIDPSDIISKKNWTYFCGLPTNNRKQLDFSGIGGKKLQDLGFNDTVQGFGLLVVLSVPWQK